MEPIACKTMSYPAAAAARTRRIMLRNSGMLTISETAKITDAMTRRITIIVVLFGMMFSGLLFTASCLLLSGF